MSDAAPGDNAAWVHADIPLPPAALLDFLADGERLWRLNPYLKIDRWQARPDGFALVGVNEANACPIDVCVRREPTAEGWRAIYERGLKRETEFAVAPRQGGSLLVVTERYAPVAGADDPRAKEADPSLVPWIAALRRHLVARQRFGRLPGWRWWHERFLPSLAPSQRRIVRLLIGITAIEFLVFLVLVLIWQLAG